MTKRCKNVASSFFPPKHQIVVAGQLSFSGKSGVRLLDCTSSILIQDGGGATETPKRWVVVENFPTAAQKVFGPGTPKDQEKFGRLLHGSHLNLNIQLPDTNLGTGRKRSCNGNFEMTFNERDDFVKAVFSNSPHLCENVVRLAEKPSRICIGRHKEFECTDVDVCAKGPEVRFLKVIDPLKLLDLQRTLLVSKCNLRFFLESCNGTCHVKAKFVGCLEMFKDNLASPFCSGIKFKDQTLKKVSSSSIFKCGYLVS